MPKPRFWFVLLPFGLAKIFQLQINNMQQVKKGDTVVFPKYTGHPIKVNAEEYLILKENEVLGFLR